MRIRTLGTGGFVVRDELPFDLNSLKAASDDILSDYYIDVSKWTLTAEFNATGFGWEALFTRPMNDTQYVEHMNES